MEHPLTTWRGWTGVSQSTLANLVGVRPSMISRIESGVRRPGPEALVRLVAVTERLAPGRGLTAGQILGTEVLAIGGERRGTSPASSERPGLSGEQDRVIHEQDGACECGCHARAAAGGV